MTYNLHQPMSRRHRDSPRKNFSDITKRTRKEKKKEGGTGYETEKTIEEDSKDCVILCTCIFFLKLLLIKNQMIVMRKMMF